ncbi:alsin homolog [Drosophila grimshawi]|uniref:GH15100 n=1 Tax=Drosophila grimshawi TaxID=7222 RepID=B4IYU6_DROGR|nr:alsin homolog [Drosophila grimshawi]EDV96633.1 GH15100 [Drosophila grimshawi]
MSSSSSNGAASGSGEAFVIYYEGKPLQLHWKGVPPLTRSPALRLCFMGSYAEGTKDRDSTALVQFESSWLLLLTADQSLYSAELLKLHGISTLELSLLRTDIVDVDFCRGSRQLFVVLTNGSVQRQLITAGGGGYRASAWQTLSFDPLGLHDEGVCMRRVCCSEQGVVFVSLNGDTYVLGSCGEVFNAEQPRHMRLCEEGKQLLDLVAGNEHFVLLVAPHQLADDVLQLQQEHSSAEEQGSLKSLQSGSSERSFTANTRHLLHQGFALLHTQLFTFGASNGGLLGTGDHIRRAHVARLEKLDGMGVCSIAAGRHHSVARTLDGRLYHWGINNREQLGEDLSSPTEICLSEQLKPEQHTALEATCGDYRTLLLNAAGQVQMVSQPPSQSSTYEQTVLHLQLGVAWPRQMRLLHCAGGYTLQNCRQFQRQYHYFLSHLQSQLQLLLKQRQAVETLLSWKLPVLAPLLLNWERIVCLVAATLHSLEGFYRADYVQPADLLFICYYREYIELFEGYTRSYCDVLSVNGFGEAVNVIGQPPLSNLNLLAELGEESYLIRMFQQPFAIYQLFMQFMELLVKTQPEYDEHRVAWSEFARMSCISQELAVNTKEFWSGKECTPRIAHLRHRQRRVILTSALVPLKLASSGLSMSSHSFILFSDFLCQLGSHALHAYPLSALWIWSEGELGLRIVTPEKNFLLMTRKAELRKVWLDQLQSSIVAALGRPLGSPVPSVRSTAYEYSREHPKFARVKACGTWRKGILHGNCYLEYPDGTVYCGEVHHGVIEGYGKMVIPSTGVYVGNFKGGRFHGFGVYELNCTGGHDSEIYEGNFCEGLFHGHGMMRNNRCIYVGEYVANARNGYGVMEDLISGDKYMGMFADNKRCGIGSCVTNRGDYFEGHFAADDLCGSGVAVFENDYYYEGELTLQGPNGRGEYYMPSGDVGCSVLGATDQDDDNCELIGNKMFGHLSGSWETVRIQNGELVLNRCFSKYPSSLGRVMVDHNRKWRALFHNFESDVANCSSAASSHSALAAITGGTLKKAAKSTLSTAQLWSCIAVYMSKQRSRDGTKPGNYFNNILLSLPLPQKSPVQPARSSTPTSQASLVSGKQTSTLDLLSATPRRIHSQETLCRKLDSLQRSDSLLSIGHNSTIDTRSLVSFSLNESLLDRSFNGESVPVGNLSSSFGNMSHNHNNNSNNATNNNNISKHRNSSNCSITSTTSTGSTMLEQVPSFGMASTLGEHDVSCIRSYLEQAFKDRYHPLYALNERIVNCFHYSYGYWKVKPTPILAKQAMREWESISRRIYRFVRKMFPALPEEYCHLDGTREVISHITLLYPLVLSEGIYSTLFVLYANKYNRKDELYRQNLNHAEKLNNEELVELLGHDSCLIAVMLDTQFEASIQMLKQLQEKFSPQDMLTVIQRNMELLTEAYEHAMATNGAQLNADNMIPLTMLSMLRAAVPHLGAELALLDDLTGGPNFQAEMNGMAGYCYTTLKAAYEHVTMRALQQRTS